MTTPELDPDLLEVARFIPTVDFSGGVTEVRSLFDSFAAELMPALSDAVDRSDHRIAGKPTVLVRVHRPRALAGPAACLFSIHGGGYVIGSRIMDDPVFDRYCVDFGCIGVSVEYRLAPETPYPGPLEDCYRALAWTFAHSSELEIDRSRIGVRGESAGGGLAAGLSLLARDRGEVDIAFTLLECPMLDDRQITPSSQYEDLRVWTRDANQLGWRSYLGDLYGTERVPAYAAPARAEDLSGLPPTLVIAGGADGFRDENILYAHRLCQAGVATDLAVIAGAPHGVELFAGTAPARRWADTVHAWLESRLASTR
jgi:acetyl esterase/lipase